MSPDNSSSARANATPAEGIATAIQQSIVDRDLEPGVRVGAERELAELYGVSRWTIRKALEQLEHRGLILRTHGRSGGVFVAPKKVVRDLSPLLGLPAYLRSQGLDAGTTILGTQASIADAHVAEAMELPPNSWVFEIRRLRLAQGIPLSIEACTFAADLFPGLLDQQLNGSLYDLLETEYGIERGAAVETVSAAPATSEEAPALQVAEGTPLLIVDRIARLRDGQAFECSRELSRADRMSIIVHTGGPEGSPRFQYSTDVD